MDGAFATESAGTVSYSDGESIDYSGSGKFLTGFRWGKYLRDIRGIASPGEDGQGTKDFGEREQFFTVEVTYINSDEASVLADILGDLRILGHVSSFDTIPMDGCALDDNKFEQARPATFGSSVQCKGNLVFKSMRPTP